MNFRSAARISLSAALIFILSFLLLPAAQAQSSIESEVLALVNQHRAANGLSPLCLDPLLNAAAAGHSQDMLTNNYFDHTGLNGSMPWTRIQATGYQGSYFAENIAMGYQSAAEVFEGWRTSPGHNANMLSANATEMGIARVGDYWTQVFSNGEPCTTNSSPITPITLPTRPSTNNGGRTPDPTPQPPTVPSAPSEPAAPSAPAQPSAPEVSAAPPVQEMPPPSEYVDDTQSYDAWLAEMINSGYTCTTTTYVDENGVTWECTTCEG